MSLLNNIEQQLDNLITEIQTSISKAITSKEPVVADEMKKLVLLHEKLNQLKKEI
jgi:hypothetical protein